MASSRREKPCRTMAREACAPLLGSLSHIAPFMDLPSKENGLDIEGLVTFRRKVYVGMRGPVVDNIALVAAIGMTRDFVIDETGIFLHFVDLGGLGVRDMTRWGDGILILAGPVNGADSPFRLLQWTPRRTGKIQNPEKVQDLQPGADHPEGICALNRAGADGLIVLYDTKSDKRISRNALPCGLAQTAGLSGWTGRRRARSKFSETVRTGCGCDCGRTLAAQEPSPRRTLVLR